MAMLTMNDLVAGMVGGQRKFFNKTQNTSVTGAWSSLWKLASDPIAGATPPVFTAGAGYVPTSATTGAISFTNPTGGKKTYLARMNGSSNVFGSRRLVDRMWACSGFVANVTTLQSVTTPGNLTSGRDPNLGLDVEPWLECYSATGATGGTWTLTGTDAAGNTGRTWTYTHTALALGAGEMRLFVPGTASTPGIRQVTSVQLGTSSGTAGDWGVTLVRPICDLIVPTNNAGLNLDALQTGLPEVFDDTCLMFMVNTSSTTTGVWFGGLALAQN